MLAARGYPGSYQKGSVIRGLEHVSGAKVRMQATHSSWPPAVPAGTAVLTSCMQVFHAGTATNADGEVLAVGGRVLAVTAMGADVAEAQTRAYRVRLFFTETLSYLDLCGQVSE